MANLYHVYLAPRPGVTPEEVQTKFDLAITWYKYGTECWIIKTTSDAAKWQTRLKPLVDPGGSLLIFKLDPTDRQGWFAKSFWEWLKENA